MSKTGLGHHRDHPVGIADLLWLGIQVQPRHACQALTIPAEKLPLVGYQRVDPLHLRNAKGGLHGAHLVLEGHFVVQKEPVPGRAAMVAQLLHPGVQVVVIGDQHPACTSGDGLRAME